MKTRTKISIATPLSLLAVMFDGEFRGLRHAPNPGPTTTAPIKHLVVIFQGNVSFDHYFGTYPVAANPPGEPQFFAAPDTPSVNGLTPALLTHNPNLFNPTRLDRSQAITCDMDHEYTAEQAAFDGGLMDKFVQDTSNNGAGCASNGSTVMNYYDGNTVTAMWEYAQNFAMNTTPSERLSARPPPAR